MSKALGKADITFSQCMCKNGGVYAGPIDGKWSNELAEAENSLRAWFDHTRAELGKFNARTEENIQTLLPQAQVVARSFMSALTGRPLTYRIISGTRTYAEQDSLYAIGRTVQLKRSPVTNAKGGHSHHNFGLAWDIGVFKGGQYYTGKNKKEESAYEDVWAYVSAIHGLEWGGHWKSFVDRPHFQLTVKPQGVSEVRKAFEAGGLFA